MSTEHKKGKRKSTAGGSSSADVQVVYNEPSTSAGPVFLNFPSVRPSKDTPWTIYSREVGSSSDLAKQRTVVAGETEDVEYFSLNRDYPSNEATDCQYLPGLYDPDTNTLTLTPAPLYLMSHRAKRLKTIPLPSQAARGDLAEYRAKRNDLGEVFGTRKAKSQIRAAERGKVNAAAMEGVRDHLMESIPVSEQVEEVEKPSDLIPTPNMTTNDPTQIYPRESIIPSAEWSAMDVGPLVKAKDESSRAALLPSRHSNWIFRKMGEVIRGPSETRKSNLKYLYYLSVLHAFHDKTPKISSLPASEVPGLFPGVPPQIINGVLSRFAEKSGKKYNVTDKCKAKLLAWMCVIYLTVDGWSTDIAKVATDLKLKPAKVQEMYQNLGCGTDTLGPAEREERGLSMLDAQKMKRAVLKAPVKFPKIKRRGPVKR